MVQKFSLVAEKLKVILLGILLHLQNIEKSIQTIDFTVFQQAKHCLFINMKDRVKEIGSVLTELHANLKNLLTLLEQSDIAKIDESIGSLTKTIEHSLKLSNDVDALALRLLNMTQR